MAAVCTASIMSSFSQKRKGLSLFSEMVPPPSLSLTNCNTQVLSTTAICLANLFLGSQISLQVDEPFHTLVDTLGKSMTVRIVELACLVLHQRECIDWTSQSCVDCEGGKYVGKGQIPPPSSITTAAASLCSNISFDNEDAESFHSASSDGLLCDTSSSVPSPSSQGSSPTPSVALNRHHQAKDAKELFVGSLSPAWQFIQVADGTVVACRLRCTLHCEGIAISVLPLSQNNNNNNNNFSRFL